MQTPESTAAGVWTWGPAPTGEPAYWGIWSPDGRLIGTTSRHERALRTVCRLNRRRYAAIGNSIAVPVLCWLGERIDLADQEWRHGNWEARHETE